MGTRFYEKDGLIINLDNCWKIQCFRMWIEFSTVDGVMETVYFETEEECSKAYEFIKDKFKGVR